LTYRGTNGGARQWLEALPINLIDSCRGYRRGIEARPPASAENRGAYFPERAPQPFARKVPQMNVPHWPAVIAYGLLVVAYGLLFFAGIHR
jgi:hypothetical protein